MSLPPQVLDAFDHLARAQRGAPEDAMVKAQRALGGGVLSFAIELTGDLTNRMAKRMHVESMAAGYIYIDEKVRPVLRNLRRPYGFEREHLENMRSNAKYAGVPLDEYMAKADAALLVYARAHAKLPVFNAMQRWARDAAVALGEKDFTRAKELLTYLEWNLETHEQWAAAATKYELTPQGLVKTL